MADIANSRGDASPDDQHSGSGKNTEWTLFLFITVLLGPVLAVAVVGGYGFLVWMMQLIAGPPGPSGL